MREHGGRDVPSEVVGRERAPVRAELEEMAPEIVVGRERAVEDRAVGKHDRRSRGLIGNAPRREIVGGGIHPAGRAAAAAPGRSVGRQADAAAVLQDSPKARAPGRSQVRADRHQVAVMVVVMRAADRVNGAVGSDRRDHIDPGAL